MLFRHKLMKKSLRLLSIQFVLVVFLAADIAFLFFQTAQTGIFALAASLLTIACIWESEQQKNHIYIPYKALGRADKILRVIRLSFICLFLFNVVAGIFILSFLSLTDVSKVMFINALTQSGVWLSILIVNTRWYWRIAFGVVTFFGIRCANWVIYSVAAHIN